MTATWRSKTVPQGEGGSGGSGGWAKAELPPVGVNGAVIVAVIDLGTHTEYFKKDAKTRDIHKLALAVELTGKAKPDGTGNWILPLELALSFVAGSKLATIAEAVLSIGIDDEWSPEDLLGRPCAADIEHNPSKKAAGKYYANLVGVKARGELRVLKSKNTPFLYKIESDAEPGIPAWVPGWIYGNKVVDTIKASLEWKAFRAARGNAPDQEPGADPASADSQTGTEEEIPF